MSFDPFRDEQAEQDRQQKRDIEYASAISEIASTRGFQLLFALLDEEANACGQRSLADEKEGRDFYRGYLKGLRFLKEEVEAIAQRGQEAQATREVLHQEFGPRISGSGSLA